MSAKLGLPFTTLHSGVAHILSSFVSKCRSCIPIKRTPYISTSIGSKLIYTVHTIPSMPLPEYIERFSRFCALTDETLIASLIYIDRVLALGNFAVTRHELHRLIVAACVISLKYNMDDYYENQYYAKVAGLTLQEMNTLERDFLNRIDYRLYIEEEEYKRYKNSVTKYIKSPRNIMRSARK